MVLAPRSWAPSPHSTLLFPFLVLLLNRLLISLVAQKSWAWSRGKEGWVPQRDPPLPGFSGAPGQSLRLQVWVYPGPRSSWTLHYGIPFGTFLSITGLGNSEIKLDTQLWLHAVEKIYFLHSRRSLKWCVYKLANWLSILFLTFLMLTLFEI